MNELKEYCVRFTMLKCNDIYLEINVCHYNADGAVNVARYVISETMDIHPDRLYLESVTLES